MFLRDSDSNSNESNETIPITSKSKQSNTSRHGLLNFFDGGLSDSDNEESNEVDCDLVSSESNVSNVSSANSTDEDSLSEEEADVGRVAQKNWHMIEQFDTKEEVEKYLYETEEFDFASRHSEVQRRGFKRYFRCTYAKRASEQKCYREYYTLNGRVQDEAESSDEDESIGKLKLSERGPLMVFSNSSYILITWPIATATLNTSRVEFQKR